MRAQRSHGTTRLDLEPLSRADSVAQIGLLGISHPERLGHIHDRSQGLPLFTEQLAAHLEDAPGLPRALADLLDRRLDGIDASAWAVLRVLGVAERPLTGPQIAAASSVSPAELTTQLHTLRARRLVRSTSDGLVQLQHPLLAEATQRRLLGDEAAQVHRSLADVLGSEPDASAAEVAQHWRSAGDAGRELDVEDRRSTELRARLRVGPGGRSLAAGAEPVAGVARACRGAADDPGGGVRRGDGRAQGVTRLGPRRRHERCSRAGARGGARRRAGRAPAQGGRVPRRARGSRGGHGADRRGDRDLRGARAERGPRPRPELQAGADARVRGVRAGPAPGRRHGPCGGHGGRATSAPERADQPGVARGPGRRPRQDLGGAGRGRVPWSSTAPTRSATSGPPSSRPTSCCSAATTWRRSSTPLDRDWSRRGTRASRARPP